jgi:hypothetical protein
LHPRINEDKLWAGSPCSYKIVESNRSNGDGRKRNREIESSSRSSSMAVIGSPVIGALEWNFLYNKHGRKPRPPFGHVSLINSCRQIVNQRCTSTLARHCARLRIRAGNIQNVIKKQNKGLIKKQIQNAIKKQNKGLIKNKGRKHHLLAGRKSRRTRAEQRRRRRCRYRGTSSLTPCIFIPSHLPFEFVSGRHIPVPPPSSGHRILATSLASSATVHSAILPTASPLTPSGTSSSFSPRAQGAR